MRYDTCANDMNVIHRVTTFCAGAASGGALAVAMLQDKYLRSAKGEPAATTEPAKTAKPVESAATDVSTFCPWGPPKSSQLFVKEGFASSVDYRTRIPSWVAEHLRRDDVDAVQPPEGLQDALREELAV